MSDLAFTASCAECYRKNQRIASLEKLCQQQHEALEFINKRCAIYGPADAARAKIMAVSDKFAALFPKTGGAK